VEGMVPSPRPGLVGLVFRSNLWEKQGQQGGDQSGQLVMMVVKV